MSVLALDDFKVRLAGDNMRISAVSGDTTVELIVSVRKARAYHEEVALLFAEHEARVADIVPFSRTGSGGEH